MKILLVDDDLELGTKIKQKFFFLW